LIKKAILLRSGVSFCQVWVRLCRLLTAAKLLAKSGKALNAADQIQIQVKGGAAAGRRRDRLPQTRRLRVISPIRSVALSGYGPDTGG
jgi:hypothetical protein